MVVVGHGIRTGAHLADWALKAAGFSCSTTTAGSWFQSLTVLTVVQHYWTVRGIRAATVNKLHRLQESIRQRAQTTTVEYCQTVRNSWTLCWHFQEFIWYLNWPSPQRWIQEPLVIRDRDGRPQDDPLAVHCFITRTDTLYVSWYTCLSCSWMAKLKP